MNRFKMCKRNGKRAVTPIIATIILIAATIVLSLVVGSYTFSLFGNNVKGITVTNLILSSGTAAVAGSSPCAGANILLMLNNPGAPSWISSISLNSGSGAVSQSLFSTSGNSCISSTTGTSGTLACGIGASSMFVYIGTTLASGLLYSYVISFKSGTTISGSLIAQ